MSLILLVALQRPTVGADNPTSSRASKGDDPWQKDCKLRQSETACCSFDTLMRQPACTFLILFGHRLDFEFWTRHDIPSQTTSRDEKICPFRKATIVCYNAVIGACGSAWQKALVLFDQTKGLQRSIITYNSTASACVKGEQWQTALSLLHELPKLKIQQLGIELAVSTHFQFISSMGW
jgi:hypothetical protein